MISYDYSKDSWKSFQDGIVREWALTNGIGGYAGSSLIGAHSRTHQGYLIASLHPPIERYLVFSKINETLDTTNEDGSILSYSLETSQHLRDKAVHLNQGQKYLESFSYDGSVHYHYRAGGISIKKHITLKQGENVCAVAYEIDNNGPDAVLSLVPLFNFREHSASSLPETLQFETKCKGQTFTLTPLCHKDTVIRFQVSEGSYEENPVPYDINMQLQIEVDLETDGLDCHYCPVSIPVDLPAGCHKKISVLCSVCTPGSVCPDITADTAFMLLDARKGYTESLYRTAGCLNTTTISGQSSGNNIPEDSTETLVCRLVLASDQFLCHRSSTGLKTVLAGLPWFTDWGRDTMIAFTGLTLCTGRFEEAREILLTFSRYIRNGIVPNMFPDDNTPPLYNTADASLWYFYAVWNYLNYTDTSEAYAFVQTEIYPHLKEIVDAYKNGTDFSIYMEEDGLIHAGSGLDQITWMDVRVGDWVATPRHGKPVEINALWYNALKIMETLSKRFSDNETSACYSALAARTKKSFCQKFWNEAWGCLYDVIDGDEPDNHLRPNQIYAVSLPFTMLSPAQERQIVTVVERNLFVGCGLRSLSRDHADYHGIYCGSLPKRDAAYHQGTAWGFLLGGFLSAYLKVHAHSPESICHAKELILPVAHHLFDDGCIGSISEIFDGDAPHHPRGCYAQAWSVGEVLRACTEDILPYLK